MNNINIYHVILDAMPHEMLELAAWSAQLFLVIVTIIAALVAAYQLREMGHFRRQRLRIANAQLLMELDNRWDSTEMHESRIIFSGMYDEINTRVGTAHPKANEDERRSLIQKSWVESLQAKRTSSQREYGKLMAICGFFETVGLMVDRQYIEVGDVFELFLGPIIDIEHCFGGHIAALEKEIGVPDGLYRYALKLSRRASASAASQRAGA